MTEQIDIYFQPALQEQKKHLIVLLPGSTGIDIYGDRNHYFKVSDWLNNEGFSTLIVDYTPCADDFDTIASVILLSLEQAVNWTRTEDIAPLESKITLLGWSLAGEGLTALINQKQLVKSMGITAFAFYFPSNFKKISVEPTEIPILVQTGLADNITTYEMVKQTFEKNSNVQWAVYENAHHGFDVESLATPKIFEGDTPDSSKILMYHKEAADKSREVLLSYLKSL